MAVTPSFSFDSKNQFSYIPNPEIKKYYPTYLPSLICDISNQQLNAEEKDYIYRAYEEICKLSKKWKTELLVNREYQFIRNESDISDGIRYIKSLNKYNLNRTPIGKYQDILTSRDFKRFITKTGGAPITFLQCFDYLALLAVK